MIRSHFAVGVSEQGNMQKSYTEVTARTANVTDVFG